MVDYERVVSVGAAPEEAFRSLTDLGNLPQYVATMVSADSLTTDRLHVAADVRGRREEGDARFRVDEAGRRMEWSGEGGGGYRGWLEVVAAGEGSSVTIHIEGAHDDERDEIDRALDETAANIAWMLSTA
jgi:Polyketide cyclase / dehydrase and lipid transport